MTVGTPLDPDTFAKLQKRRIQPGSVFDKCSDMDNLRKELPQLAVGSYVEAKARHRGTITMVVYRFTQKNPQRFRVLKQARDLYWVVRIE